MKKIESIKEIWKSNKRGYFMSSIIFSLGSFFLYARQHNKFTFDIAEYFMCLPFVLILLLVFMFGFALFLGDDGK